MQTGVSTGLVVNHCAAAITSKGRVTRAQTDMLPPKHFLFSLTHRFEAVGRKMPKWPRDNDSYSPPANSFDESGNEELFLQYKRQCAHGDLFLAIYCINASITAYTASNNIYCAKRAYGVTQDSSINTSIKTHDAQASMVDGGTPDRYLRCDGRPSTPVRASTDDIDWPVHSLTLSFHDFRGLPL